MSRAPSTGLHLPPALCRKGRLDALRHSLSLALSPKPIHLWFFYTLHHFLQDVKRELSKTFPNRAESPGGGLQLLDALYNHLHGDLVGPLAHVDALQGIDVRKWPYEVTVEMIVKGIQELEAATR